MAANFSFKVIFLQGVATRDVTIHSESIHLGTVYISIAIQYIHSHFKQQRASIHYFKKILNK